MNFNIGIETIEELGQRLETEKLLYKSLNEAYDALTEHTKLLEDTIARLIMERDAAVMKVSEISRKLGEVEVKGSGFVNSIVFKNKKY